MNPSQQTLETKLLNAGLSRRETEVATLVTMGLSNAEIAGQLFITQATVKFHLDNIYRRTGKASRAQLIIMCLPYLSDKYADVHTPVRTEYSTLTGLWFVYNADNVVIAKYPLEHMASEAIDKGRVI